MVYKSIITRQAIKQEVNIFRYLLEVLKSQQAGLHFSNELHKIYIRLEDNPFQFPECNDKFLKSKGYRKADMTDMKYIIIFRVENESKIVYILGIFHMLENYKDKL